VIEKFERWWDAEDYHQNCSCRFWKLSCISIQWYSRNLCLFHSSLDLHNNPGGYEVCQWWDIDSLFDSLYSFSF
jgi:hypothetical protein